MPRTLSQERDRYDNAFKRLAVLLTHHPDILAQDIANSLGIHPVMLYRWRMEMKKGEIPGSTKLNDLQSETDLLRANQQIKQLKKELAQTKKERDFLKKAKRFFQGKNKTSSRS